MPDQIPPAASSRQARKTLGLLLAINMLNYVDRQVLAAGRDRSSRDDLFPHSAADTDFWLKINPSVEFWMGLLPTAFLVSYMLASAGIWLARDSDEPLGDCRRRRNRVEPGLRCVGTGHDVWFAAGARLCVGVREAAYGPVAPTLISDMFPLSRSAAPFYRIFISPYRWAALPDISSAAWSRRSGPGIGLSFLFGPAGYCVLGLMAFFMREPPRRGRRGAEISRSAKLSDYGTFSRTPSYVLCTAGMTAL